MTYFGRIFAAAAVLGLAGCATGPRPVAFSSDGTTPYAVVVGPEASPSTRHGAEELQRFLGEMTGAPVPLVEGGERVSGPAIYVGMSPAAEAKLRDDGLRAADFGPEEYALRTQGRDVFILGGEPRGTLYGVYGLLEDHLGCRWFTPEVSRIPKTDALVIPVLDERVAPVLEYREPFTMDAFDGDWCARNRMNSSTGRLEDHHGGKVRFGSGLFVHTFDVLMPPSQYFAEHPEYYSLVDGARLGERSQLCCTNEDVIRICTEELLKRIAADPDAYVYSVSQNDWYNYCECEPCTELAEREGSQMGPMLHLVNRVAAEVAKVYPDKAVETLAYQYTRKPPATMRPLPNVIIRLCSIECDFLQPLATSDFPDNVSFVEDLKGWSEISDRLWIWDYVTSFRAYLCPFPNLRLRDDNIRLFIENNVTGIFEQDVYNTLNGELSGLSAYINAKFLWDPNYDEDTAINEFLEGVYGPAAPHIRGYIDYLHDYVAERNLHEGIWVAPRNAEYLTDETLAASDAYWKAATTAVMHDAELAERVAIARLPVDYAIIDRANANGMGGYLVDHEKFTAEINPEFAGRVRRFFETARRANVTLMSEHTNTLDLYEEQFKTTLEGDFAAFTPREAVTPGAVKPGLRYGYHEGAWDVVPDFKALTPKTTGVSATFDIDRRERDEYFGLWFEGYIRVPQDGMYTLYIESNDGSKLYLGGEAFVTNDGLHDLDTRGKPAALRAGLHAIRAEYFQAGLNKGFQVYWEGPGIAKAPVPAEALFHR